MTGRVVAVHVGATHSFTKQTVDVITLLEGRGVEGDAHCGVTVKHRSRVASDPGQPNLRQVHLMHAELFVDLAQAGYAVRPGDLGENITTRGVDLLSLPAGTRLTLGDAVIVVTGLRNPCHQINTFQPGLLKEVARPDEAGHLVRLAGVMGIIARGGQARPGDVVAVALPEGTHHPLTPV